ncbi:polysaccharide biosynthesis/export family protein [Desulfovulcanus sp.]
MKKTLVLFSFIFIVQTMAVFAADVQYSEKFVLGPGDVLEISVWGDDNLNRKVLVRPDGLISFPLIGDIVAKGKTIDALRTEIKNKIQEYVPDSPVTVLLAQLGSTKIYVVGKVNKPGVYLMDDVMTITQALALAGGMTPYAESDEIKIIRWENNSQKVINFDYTKIEKGKALSENIVLKPGDTIVVP